jgi:hypothetical protein
MRRLVLVVCLLASGCEKPESPRLGESGFLVDDDQVVIYNDTFPLGFRTVPSGTEARYIEPAENPESLTSPACRVQIREGEYKGIAVRVPSRHFRPAR